MTGSCCYYASNNLTNSIDTSTYINITTGPVWGMTPMNFNKNCELDIPSTLEEGERGSIICNSNINRIQVESVYFKRYGELKCDAIIFDPNNACFSQQCQLPNNKEASLGPVQPGCPKSFSLGIPPEVDGFMISVVCYRNFRYGNFIERQASNSLEYLNSRSSYRELYRFCWWIDITRSGMVCPIFALGPYRNFDIGMERFARINSDSGNNQGENNIVSDDTTDDDVSSLNLTDNLVVSGRRNNSSNPNNGDGLSLQPFYVGVSGSDRLLDSNLTSNISNFASGSTGNICSGNFNNSIGNLNSSNAILTSNLMPQNGQMGSTLCASFNLTNSDKRRGNCNGDLTQIFNNCNGCLTLFVPCPRGDIN